mmetsp:Transcript_28110/g.89877  ORF Transcript_28110/g.89877 Transcript_28110/m.89877 type:complete len:273 (-) Transcript_28110:359-1177(-)
MGHRLRLLPEHRLEDLGPLLAAGAGPARRQPHAAARAVRHGGLHALREGGLQDGEPLARPAALPERAHARRGEPRDGDPHVQHGQDGGAEEPRVEPHQAGPEQGRLGAILHVRHALLQLRHAAQDLGGPRRRRGRRRRRQRPAGRDGDRRRPAAHGQRRVLQGSRRLHAHRRGRDGQQDHLHPHERPARGARERRLRPRPAQAGHHLADTPVAQALQDERRQAGELARPGGALHSPAGHGPYRGDARALGGARRQPRDRRRRLLVLRVKPRW